MARPTTPRPIPGLYRNHDNAQAKTSFFLGVAYAPDRPMAVSNKGETALKPNKYNGLACPNWPRLAATVAAS